MADKVTLTDLANFQNETTAVLSLNNNNAAVTTAMNNTLSRDGSSPNTMSANLDMNSNRILNLPAPLNQNEPARLIDVTGDQVFTVTTPVNGTIAINARTKSNVPITTDDAIVLTNALYTPAKVTIRNAGDTPSQSGTAGLHIYGGYGEAQQMWTNASLIWPSDYVAGTTYAKGDVVNDPFDGKAYTSQSAGNIGHTPHTDGAVHWVTQGSDSVEGILVYDDPTDNINGFEMGQAALSFWVVPQSPGTIGGEMWRLGLTDSGLVSPLPMLSLSYLHLADAPLCQINAPTNLFGSELNTDYITSWSRSPQNPVSVMRLYRDNLHLSYDSNGNTATTTGLLLDNRDVTGGHGQGSSLCFQRAGVFKGSIGNYDQVLGTAFGIYDMVFRTALAAGMYIYTNNATPAMYISPTATFYIGGDSAPAATYRMEINGKLLVDTDLVVGGAVVCGPAIATNATAGFLYIPTCAGVPTGVPTTFAGRVAMIYNTTNDKLYVYNGGWKGGTAPGAWT